MTPEQELLLSRKEAAAKAQYEYLLGKKWEEETQSARNQWIGSLEVALDAADEVMLTEPSLSFIATLLGGLKFPDKEWEDLTEETRKRLMDCAGTVIEATQGK